MITAVTTDFGPNPSAGTQQWFTDLKAKGHAGFGTTVNAWNSTDPWPDCGRFLDMALTAGFWVFVYCRFPEGWENGLNGLGPAMAGKLKFFAEDVEPEFESPVVHPVQSHHIEGLVKSNQRPVIYTNASMWAEIMGPDPGLRFATVPLYDRAIKGTKPTAMNQSPLSQFGGWNTTSNMRRVWQYADPVTIGGVGCTLQVVDSRWI